MNNIFSHGGRSWKAAALILLVVMALTMTACRVPAPGGAAVMEAPEVMEAEPAAMEDQRPAVHDFIWQIHNIDQSPARLIADGRGKSLIP
jgi:hypothetical protein